MKLLKGLLLGSVASVAGIAQAPRARAADLPERQAAPIEYVRICDAYGAGFFYIPGTDTCLRGGGLVLGEFRSFDPSYSIGGTSFYGNGITPVHSGLTLAIPSGLGYVPSVTRYTNARSLDATSSNALGRVDLQAEDQASRRADITNAVAGMGTAPGGTVPVTINGVNASSFQPNPAAAYQNDASLFGAGAIATPAATVAGSTSAAYDFPAATSNDYGFVVQGGLQLNADYLSPGDKLWLQAAYEKGAFGYIAGNNLGFNYGAVNQNRYGGPGFTPSDYSAGWNPQPGSDCGFTSSTPASPASSASCQQRSGWDITGAYKHYWLPTLASAVFGSYLEIHYSGAALAGFGGEVGISNIEEGRGDGTNQMWTPLKGFDIGTEFMYVHLNQLRPAGLASDAVLEAAGLPAFQSNTNQYEGRLRVQRAF